MVILVHDQTKNEIQELRKVGNQANEHDYQVKPDKMHSGIASERLANDLVFS